MNVIECLTIVFIVLKLVKVISWSWLWVISPICVDICLPILILFIKWLFDLDR